jgi:hypothetical protein
VFDTPILGRSDDRQFNQIVGLYDAPAYVRRARQVQEALDGVLMRCRRQRDEWLTMVRTRLGVLGALAADWSRLRPLLTGEDRVEDLRSLHDSLKPQLRVPVPATSSRWVLRRALRELRESIERFNGRWPAFLQTIDLTPVNKLREGYNRYYLLEKECAVRSASVARQGFRKLEPVTNNDLLTWLPVLPVP